MDLIRPEKEDLFLLIVEDCILRNHFVCFRDPENSPGEIKVMTDGSVFFIQPAREKFPIQFCISRRCEILRIHGVTHHKHLDVGEDTTEFPLGDVLLYLPESVHVGVILIFQFDMDERKPIDQESDVKTAILIGVFCFEGLILVNNLVDGSSSSYMLVVKDNEMEQFVPSLDVDIHASVFSHQPLSGIIERGMGKIVFYLGEFGVREGRVIQASLIVLFEDIAKVGPEIRFCSNVWPICPLGIITT